MALVVNKGKVERIARECISPKSGKGGSHVCVFCFNGADEEKYGKMFTKAGVTVHYFCMLFSSGLCQNGKSEKEGILGFIQQDILKEVKRGYRLKCNYCRKSGATIGCVVRNCKKMFHLGCGRCNGTLHQFFGTFCSFCPDHRVQQDIPSDDDPNIVCSICMNTVKAAPSNTTLRAPCCKKYWYHRDCVQAYAMSAGLHFFKCPLCNNKDEFQDEMLTMGIYIPDQDASWEKEPNAFQELLERYGQCDAPNCRCDKGRTFSKDESKWEIILCDFCGSHGSHKACKHLIKHGKNKICQGCKEVDDRSIEGHNKGLGKKSSPAKRKSLEALNSSKALSTYPGPSSAMKKKGLPQLDGRKKKRRKTATVSYIETSSDCDEDSGDSVKLCPPLPAQSVGKFGRMKKKPGEKSTKWIGSSQSILRDWLQSKNAKTATTSTTQRVPTPKASPKKKKPMVVKWKGKELLIKSPRVVLHRKRIYSRRNMNPRNLTIDMSDGKLGSDWNKEMELLTNIDTEKRVTRNMIDIDAAKSVFDKNKVTNRKLILNDVSPKKQYVPLFPDLHQTCSSPTSKLPCEALNNLDKNKPKLKSGSPSKNSSMKKKGKRPEINSYPRIGRHKKKYKKRKGDNYPKETLLVRTPGHPGTHADIVEVMDAEGKIFLKKKTLPLDNSDDKSTNAAYSKDTTTSSPDTSKFGDLLKSSLKSPYVRNCNTNPTSLVLISDDEVKSSYGEITPKAARNQMKQSVNDKSEDSSPIWRINTKKPNCIDGFLWQFDESPIFPTKITKDSLSTQFINSSNEKTPELNSFNKNSPGSSTTHQIIPIVIEDSPANNLRCRKLAYTDVESHCNGDNANDAKKYEKLDFKSNFPTLIDRLRNYSFQLDQYKPTLKTNSDERLNTHLDGTQLSSHDALGNDSENSSKDMPASSMESKSESVEKVFKQNNESERYWQLDGTRQIGEISPHRNSENKYKRIHPSTPHSDHGRPASARSSPRKLAILSTPPSRSSARKTETSAAEVVDTLSDLQNIIPSYDIEIDSPDDICDTAKNLSPSYFTKFRNALSRSESLDSITKNTLGKDLSVMMHGAESPVSTVPCKYFPQPRQNILSTINEHSSNYVKLRSSPRRCHKGESNKVTEHASNRDIVSECSPRHCHKKSSDKADGDPTDKSIMSEYYDCTELLDEADSDIRLLPLGQFLS